ncbi:MAG: undecaprenyl-diphosphate phosphatase, partial [Candidatus Cloacimonadaceae bacterium]|nr:undecaprenyl-diphosphate phosphatase [Candidatus Cloacimonadaceae bacterium]
AYFGTAAILFLMVLFYKGKKIMKDLKWSDALIIGLFQAMALVPGFSRAGFTLFGALLVGMEKTEALRFSFLISIPAILGAFVLELASLESSPISPGIAVVALLVSAISGLIAIFILKHYLKNSRLHMFGLYCLGLGILLISLFR